MDSLTQNKNWFSKLKKFQDKRFIFVLINSIFSGLPWVILGSVLSAWLKDEGISRSSIGLLSIVGSVYAFNFLWAPVVDNFCPKIFTKLGKRRFWLLLSSIIICVFTAVLSVIQVGDNLFIIGLVCLFIAISGATMDTNIDAYRIELFGENETEKLMISSSLAVAGWWIGFSYPGAMAFYLADSMTWSSVYLFLTTFYLAYIVFVLFFMPNAKYANNLNKPSTQSSNYFQSFLFSYYQSIASFFKKYSKFAILILLFLFLFKIGEAFLGKMSIVFYKEIGFSNEQIGLYAKAFGGTWIIIFSLVSGAIIINWGLFPAVVIGGIAMALSNLGFAYLAYVGHDTTILMASVFIDNFTSAISNVALVTFIAKLCDRAFTATQYALLASITTSGRTMVAASSGFLIDYLSGDWSLFFIITAIMIIPSLVVLFLMKSKLKALKVIN